MGTYTNNNKVRELYPLIDRTSSITSAQVEFYITQAESVINGFIAFRYSLPFPTIPQLVITFSSELSLLNLLDRFFTSEQPKVNEWRDKRKEELFKLLGGVKKGEILLILGDGSTVGQRTDIGGIKSNTKNFTPTFNHLDEINQTIDPDRIEDELDAVN